MKPCLSDQFVQVPCCGPPQASAWKEVFPSVQSASCSIRTKVSVPNSACEVTVEDFGAGNALSNLQPCGHSAVETCDGTRMCLQSTELK